MRILILENDQYMISSKDTPVIGRYYSLEDAVTGTQAQNKAFHALIQEYFKTGMHSYNPVNFADFKNIIKRQLGAGFEAFVYADYCKESHRIIIKDAKKYEDIPGAIRHDPAFKNIIRGRLKSWASYTKKERQKTMDNLITEMKTAGVNSKKFNEILGGMEDNNDA